MISNQMNILEVGFGTGLNCFLTINYLLENQLNIKLFYHALEPFPVDKKLINKLIFIKKNLFINVVFE